VRGVVGYVFCAREERHGGRDVELVVFTMRQEGTEGAGGVIRVCRDHVWGKEVFRDEGLAS
jgi:hypothetical protein